MVSKDIRGYFSVSRFTWSVFAGQFSGLHKGMPANLNVKLASGTMFRSSGGTFRTAFGQVLLRKALPADTLFSDLYNFPGKAVEIMDFIRAAARGNLSLSVGKFYRR